MNEGVLKLLNAPAGFDVFTQAEEGAELIAAEAGAEVPLGGIIRLARQAQFEGSAEILFAIDGVRQPAEETGQAQIREDRLRWVSTGRQPYALQTQSKCFQNNAQE